jgi:hypothetical protein
VSTKMAVFWVVAPCSLVEVYQRFRGPCCLHHQGDIALMMEAARIFVNDKRLKSSTRSECCFKFAVLENLEEKW